MAIFPSFLDFFPEKRAVMFTLVSLRDEMLLENLMVAFERNLEKFQDSNDSGEMKRLLAERTRIFKRIETINPEVAVLILTGERQNVRL